MGEKQPDRKGKGIFNYHQVAAKINLTMFIAVKHKEEKT
jgi:hypothetical protein